jgi:arylformamidase
MRIVDLTHPFDVGMPVFPGLPEASFRAIANVADDGYAMTELHLLKHIGTHVDAPAHQVGRDS